MSPAPGGGGGRAVLACFGREAAAGSSGILTATRGKLRRLFCLERGTLILAASNVREEQLVEALAGTGIVPAEDLAELRRAIEGGAHLGGLLENRGIPPEHPALVARAREHVLQLLRSTLEWPDGRVTFRAGKPHVEGEITVALDARRVVVELCTRRPSTVELVRTWVGPPDARLTRSERAPAIVDGLDDPVLPRVLAATDGTRAASEIASAVGVYEERAWRGILALSMLGALEVEGAGQDEVEPETGAMSRDEILGWLSRVDAKEHYHVLGLDRSADRDAIREAYYTLARKLHPDRFRSGAMADLLERIEEFFTKVTEAYNTLYDPERRSDYDALLDAETDREAKPQTDRAYLARENFARARLLADRRRYTEALGFLENAIQLDGNRALYRLELGRLLGLNPRRRAEAERALLYAVTLDPSLRDAYLALGQLYRRAGRNSDAARMFREVLQWDPTHAEAKAALDEMGEPIKGAAASERGGLRAVFGG